MNIAESAQHPENDIRLTEYSRGAGCGCKISPQILDQILHTDKQTLQDKNLLVGNASRDDAAVYATGNGQALISTTDFFMPIVDDAYDFGRIASANAISDVYAMGGKPLLALAILGWPIEKLPASLAQKVMNGARAICAEAGIQLAGGHSVDSAEPIFGLAVTGTIAIENLKQNNSAREGDLIFLTKPIGTGILSTAQKRNVIDEAHLPALIKQMSTLNAIGAELGKLKEVTAMTDVTGFGLLGHLIEMSDGADLTAEIFYDAIPVIEGVRDYLAKRIIPDATYRNWNSYSTKTSFEKGVNVMEAFNLLPDPQTNGGILFTISESAIAQLQDLLSSHNLNAYAKPIGKMVSRVEKSVVVRNGLVSGG